MTQRVLTEEVPINVTFRHFLTIPVDSVLVKKELGNADSHSELPVSSLRIHFPELIGIYFDVSFVHLLYTTIKQCQLSLFVCSLNHLFLDCSFLEQRD
jgi:hypothetical protein